MKHPKGASWNTLEDLAGEAPLVKFYEASQEILREATLGSFAKYPRSFPGVIPLNADRVLCEALFRGALYMHTYQNGSSRMLHEVPKMEIFLYKHFDALKTLASKVAQ